MADLAITFDSGIVSPRSGVIDLRQSFERCRLLDWEGGCRQQWVTMAVSAWTAGV